MFWWGDIEREGKAANIGCLLKSNFWMCWGAYQPLSLLMCGQAVRRAGQFCSAFPKLVTCGRDTSPPLSPCTHGIVQVLGRVEWCIPGVDHPKRRAT